MRSGKNYTISSNEVYSECQQRLLNSKLVKDHGWLCTATVVVGIVLARRHVRFRSLGPAATCPRLPRPGGHDCLGRWFAQDLARAGAAAERNPHQPAAPSPATAELAGRDRPPFGSRTTASRRRAATKSTTARRRRERSHFHAYATACIVQYGYRYTLALTWVRRHESLVRVLRRVLGRIREIGLKIKRLLLDRAFFTVPLMGFLQQQNIPFLMPVMFRGRKPKKGRPATGLRRLKRQSAGWYPYTMKGSGREKSPFQSASVTAAIGSGKPAGRGGRSCCLRRGGCRAVLPRFASVTGNGSASKAAIARFGRGASTPARTIPRCGCSLSPWR